MTKEQLEPLVKSPFRDIVILYLRDSAKELKDIEGIGNYQELLGHQIAVKKLENIGQDMDQQLGKWNIMKLRICSLKGKDQN